MKGVRLGLISVAGRVLEHARRLIIRVSRGHSAYGLLLEVRVRIQALQGRGGAPAPQPP